jgi:hypothetical protein
VKPGIVLSSLSSTVSPSTKKSARARPLQPASRKAISASSRTRKRAVFEMRAGTTSSIPPSAYFAS